MSTKLKLNIVIALSLIAFGIVVEYSAILIFKKNFVQQRKISGIAILDTVKNDLDFAVSISNKNLAEKVAKKILNVSYIDSLRIYVADSTFFKLIKNSYSPIYIEKLDTLVLANKKVSVKYILGLNLKDFQIALNQFKENISIIIIALILLIYFFISFFIEKFLNPINSLLLAVKELKAGEYKKITKKSSKELQPLIDTFNSFVENLKVKDSQLQNKIKELQDKIKEIQALQKIIINTEKLASIGTMAAGIAHEINNPLAGIKGVAEILLYIEDVQDEKIREALNNIVINCDRIADIIKKLKGYSKIESKKDYFIVKDLINDAIDILNNSKKIPNYVKFKGNFNKSDAKVYCIRNELIQVFINLIENSVYACNKNCEIEINILEDSSKLKIIFKDNGPGIPENIKDKIFDPFFTTKREGTGLGLFICHKIITENNGYIELLNNKNGACFRIIFNKQGENYEKKDIDSRR